jgi:hypothetical protein
MKMALGALRDVEGAVDRTLFEVIQKATEQHEVESTIYTCISYMLEIRDIMTTYIHHTSLLHSMDP